MKTLFLSATIIITLGGCGSATNSSDSNLDNDSLFQKDKLKTEEESEEFGVWKQVSKADDFGDEAKEKTTYAIFKGTMSNSAVSDADLCVRIDFDKEGKNCYFQFLEHCNLKTNLPRDEFINVDAKNDNGEISQIKMLLFNGLLAENNGELCKLLKANQSIKLLVDLSRVNKTKQVKYVFTITSKGLMF